MHKPPIGRRTHAVAISDQQIIDTYRQRGGLPNPDGPSRVDLIAFLEELRQVYGTNVEIVDLGWFRNCLVQLRKTGKLKDGVCISSQRQKDGLQQSYFPWYEKGDR